MFIGYYLVAVVSKMAFTRIDGWQIYGVSLKRGRVFLDFRVGLFTIVMILEYMNPISLGLYDNLLVPGGISSPA